MEHQARTKWRFQPRIGLKWQSEFERSQKSKENPTEGGLNLQLSAKSEKQSQKMEQSQNWDEPNQQRLLEEVRQG
jgi:hypothetical protein